MCRANQLGGATELGVNSVAVTRPPPHHAAPTRRQSLETRTSLGADGLAGEHGLIKEDISFGQFHVRRHDATE